MDKFDITATNIILKLLAEKLDRRLTDNEHRVFSMPRSGMAYEMIIDQISDSRETKDDIENYVKNVLAEYDTMPRT